MEMNLWNIILVVVCYQLEIGVEKNETKAFKNYKKSAKKEYDKAQLKLGTLYERGKGTERI